MKTREAGFLAKPCTAFAGLHPVAYGSLVDVALTIKDLEEKSPTVPILVFDDAMGRVVELDLRGSTAEIVARLTKREREEAAAARRARRAQAGEGSGRRDALGAGSRAAGAGQPASPPPVAQPPGRPKLGVVAREVTLLPRHWEWLAEQPNGASAALRRLVEEARLADNGSTARRQATEAAYRFLSTIAGSLPGFEEATRALFAGDWKGFEEKTAEWPGGIRIYAERLGKGES